MSNRLYAGIMGSLVFLLFFLLWLGGNIPRAKADSEIYTIPISIDQWLLDTNFVSIVGMVETPNGYMIAPGAIATVGYAHHVPLLARDGDKVKVEVAYKKAFGKIVSATARFDVCILSAPDQCMYNDMFFGHFPEDKMRGLNIEAFEYRYD